MADTTPAPTSKRLDHIPVIANAITRLGIREVVDDLVRVDPRSNVTTGECVEALITSILLGRHALYQVDELLEPFDLQVAFGFRDRAEAVHFNDTRLAKALDDLFDVGGVAKVNAAATLAAVRAYDLDTKQVHLDTTSVSVYGEYEASTAPSDAEDLQAVPHVTYGYSKARRPDLKQIVFSLGVTGDGAVPIFGRVSSGNRSDAEELRFTLKQIYEAMPSPEETLFVGDSKLFCGETLAMLEGYDLSYVTLLPRSFSLWQEAYARFRADRRPAPALKTKGDTPEELLHWRGRSYDSFYEFTWDSSHYSVPVRLLVVESDALKARKEPALKRRQEKERLVFERLKKKEASRVYACEKDAQQAAARIRKKTCSFHKVWVEIVADKQRVKRSAAGRPRKGEEHEYEAVWRIKLKVEADVEAFARVFAEESCFVLVTNLSAGEAQTAEEHEAADRRVLRAYNDQNHVERCFRWAKDPLRVAPIFLKTPKRIAALGLVYVLALMVYTLIQRDARARLKRAKTTMPGNKGWTASPTTEVIFRLFNSINVLRTGEPGSLPLVLNMNTEQIRVLKLLGVDCLDHTRVRVAPPHTPRRGSRASKPIPRKTPRGRKTKEDKKSKKSSG